MIPGFWVRAMAPRPLTASSALATRELLIWLSLLTSWGRMTPTS